MREALTPLSDPGFSAMGLRRIEAEIEPLNTASSALLRRLGFQREGLLRQRWFEKGNAVDVEIYGLLNHEWPAAASRAR